MPEMPEVETIRCGLNGVLLGLTILKVEVLEPKSFQNMAQPVSGSKALIGESVQKVRRFAKVLVIDLSGGLSLVIHLKMTGQLVYRGVGPSTKVQGDDDGVHLEGRTTRSFGGGHPTDSLIHELPDKSTRVVVSFTDGSHLYFNDQRKFGYVRVYKTADVESIPFINKLGPEPRLHEGKVDPKLLKQFLSNIQRHPRVAVKAAILNQQVVAGIGNIYADEALWMARIHPKTPVQNLTENQLKQLYAHAAEVMALSIEKGGSTARNYVRADGTRGAYLDFANVYGRANEPCHRCGTLLEKITVAGRGSTICPNCQKVESNTAIECATRSVIIE